MENKDSIEKFLYSHPVGGWPHGEKLKVYTGFEVGGAYEDWGWIVELSGNIIACHRNLDECLKIARDVMGKRNEQS